MFLRRQMLCQQYRKVASHRFHKRPSNSSSNSNPNNSNRHSNRIYSQWITLTQIHCSISCEN